MCTRATLMVATLLDGVSNTQHGTHRQHEQCECDTAACFCQLLPQLLHCSTNDCCQASGGPVLTPLDWRALARIGLLMLSVLRRADASCDECSCNSQLAVPANCAQRSTGGTDRLSSGHSPSAPPRGARASLPDTRASAALLTVAAVLPRARVFLCSGARRGRRARASPWHPKVGATRGGAAAAAAQPRRR